MSGAVWLALDSRCLLFLVIAEGAQPLSVVEAGVAPGRVGLDVVGVPDRGIAERPAAGHVPPADETGQGLREDSADGLHRDQLTGGGVRVEPAQGELGRSSVRPQGLLGAVREGAQSVFDLSAHRLSRDRPVPLDLREVPAPGVQQCPIGDDHAEVKVGTVDAVLQAEQRRDEGIRLNLLMAAPVPARTETLGLQREALADLHRIHRGKPRGDHGHPVLTSADAHAASLPCMRVPSGLALGVGLGDGRCDLAAPLLGAAAVQRREAISEEGIDLLATSRGEGGDRGGGGPGGALAELALRHGAQHHRHRLDQAAGGRESAAGERRRSPRSHRDVPNRGALGATLRLLERFDRIGLLRRIGIGRGSVLLPERVCESDDAAHLQGIHRGPLLVQAPEHVGVLARGAGSRGEEAGRLRSQFDQEEPLIAQELRQRRRAARAHGVEQLPGGVIARRCLGALREVVHALHDSRAAALRTPRIRDRG